MSNSGKIWDTKEVYTLQRGNQWITGNGSKALIGGGYTPSSTNKIETFNITVTGNATDFGDLTAAAGEPQPGSSAIHGYWALGGSSERVSFEAQGNTANFVSLGITPRTYGAAGDSTRSMFMGNGAPSFSNTVEYIETAGNGFKADFGNLSNGTDRGGACSSPTRTLFAGGEKSDGSNTNAIDFFTTTTTGNATDFGDLTVANRYPGGASSTTRGLFFNGYSSTRLSSIDVVEIASTGNATDFGDLTSVYVGGATTSNKIRAVHCGGSDGSIRNAMEFVTIATNGNATDFGDMTEAKSSPQACSNGYGGLTMGALPRQSVTYMPGSGRTLFLAGSESSTAQSDMDLIHIPTTGNASDFGNLVTATRLSGSCASLTRGLNMGGVNLLNSIESIEFASQGNAADFGDLTISCHLNTGLASTTRGVSGGAYTGSVSDVINYVTIASAGNATDFGNLLAANAGPSGAASSTRGLFAGGDLGSSPNTTNVIQYITIASTGNATDFGDLTAANRTLSGTSSGTRALFAGGNDTTMSNVIAYVTIASTGDASDFGDLSQARGRAAAGSNSIRGVFAGGTHTGAPAYPDSDVIDFVTISTTGDAADFGDLTAAKSSPTGASDSHGGLQA